jgi:transposase
MAKKRKKARREEPSPRRPTVTETPLDQMRTAASTLVRDGKAEDAVEMVLQAVAAVLRENRNLQMMVLKLQHERAGKKSERLNPEQLALVFEFFRESNEPTAAAVNPETESREDATITDEIDTAAADLPDAERKKRRRNGWKAGAIEHVDHHHELPAEERTCERCGNVKDRIGEEVTHRLRFEPGRFVEDIHHLDKYACATCHEGSVPTAPAPPQVIDRSAADASLLAHVVVSKYADHNPLTRLSGIYARTGVEIPVSTLADWIGQVGELLKPLSDELVKKVLDAYVIGTDATGIRVLDPSHAENIQWGTMWCYVGDRRTVVFRYTPTGEGATGPWEFLKGRSGYIQADAHSVYDRIFDGAAANAVEVGCWFHGRRRLVALMETDYRVAYPLLLIRRLYRLDTLADVRLLDADGRRALRRERSQSVLDRIKSWAATTQKLEPPDTDIAKAAAYILNHWTALSRFIDDGRLHLDNNIVEQQNRYIAVGRKNYLFCGSHQAAQRAATLYSLTRTCALNEVPPLPYFTDVLRKLAEGWPQSRIGELLPDRWTPAA